ncbi:MAG: metal-binding protein [Piscirickettsiaceae bacterium]|nr:MAG: metal-binding protein [Piscirickettsiaceae bacterium]PCI65267.1 MAG: metal-binding protein [Piscirickettsiaceae bacterium]
MKLKYMLLVVSLLILVACSDKEVELPVLVDNKQIIEPVNLDVYKSPTCECCGKWVDHMSKNGFSASTHHPLNLAQLKSDKGIAPRYQSCHTGISKDGYIFEGHIPATVIKRFLDEKPKGALGLSVPGMPIGSPGMEMGNQYDDYDVLLLMKDGSATVYQQIRKEV